MRGFGNLEIAFRRCYICFYNEYAVAYLFDVHEYLWIQ
jgi:hypothetical protein